MSPRRWGALIEQKITPLKQDGRTLSVLDAGCGTGAISLAVAVYGNKVTGIDLAENMVAHARQNAREAGVDATFIQGDGSHLPFDDGTFDVVVNRNVLWGLVEPESALAEWHRVLKPGGMLVYFDSAWYAYLTDEDLDEKRRQRYGRGTSPTYDVLEAAVWDLPLTREKRPGWDVAHLKPLGFANVSAEDVSSFVWDAADQEKFSFAPQFMVCATKPGEASRNDAEESCKLH
jgi:SAM-dependent methyltransferase